jgi:hypothetical protein
MRESHTYADSFTISNCDADRLAHMHTWCVAAGGEHADRPVWSGGCI